MMLVEIDRHSGFCGGVIRAIGNAEKFLQENGGTLYSLGAIVHNEEELSRLQSMGLETLDKDDLDRMVDTRGKTLLIRAHGEPPQVYAKAENKGFTVIDCTCPVVLKLQKDICSAYENVKAGDGTVVLFGKIGHPEVLGLVGQVGGDVLVVENVAQLDARLEAGELRTDRDIELFSQTTMSPVAYMELCHHLEVYMKGDARLNVHDTICSQMSSRHKELSEFAIGHDVIVFVSGKESSNGKVLCELCRSCNIRTFHIGSVSELQSSWFGKDDKVGVCGATSTPKWLLEQVAQAIENMQ